MAAPLEEDRLRNVLHALIELLESLDEPHSSYAEGLRSLDLQVEEARDRDSPELLQYAVRDVLGLFGGMGSFRDVVLMDARGVLPEQEEFYDLRHQLFEAARDELR